MTTISANFVAPHAGAWIETDLETVLVDYNMSPPTRGRGLKHQQEYAFWLFPPSPPTRGRGLKLAACTCSPLPMSRPPRGGVD